MKGKGLFVLGLLLLGLAWAQPARVDYRAEARSAFLLYHLEGLARSAQGEEKLLGWAKEVQTRAQTDHQAQRYFQAAREAEAAWYLYRAARTPSEPPKRRAQEKRPLHRGLERLRWNLEDLAQRAVDRAEKELDYYRAQDPLVRSLVEEAKTRLAKEPARALLLARAALALIAAGRGF